MSGKIALQMIITFCIVGCAEPKYLESPANAKAEGIQEAKADCKLKFKGSGLCLTWSWEQLPASGDEGSIIFKIFRINSFDQTPIEIDSDILPQLVLWMPEMGHGSSPTVTERLDTGTYRAKKVIFVMPGKWELKFQIRENKVVLDETVDSINI